MKEREQKIDFAFLIHPRSKDDVLKKYPIFRRIPEKLMEIILLFWPCIIVGTLKGVNSTPDQRELKGLLIGISMTPQMMVDYPWLVKRKIGKAIRKARLMGAKMVGLGGWIPAFTGYGLDLEKTPDRVGITTGHAYAAWTIASYAQEALEKKSIETERPVVAIVGAAGSTGSLVAEVLIESGLRIDLLFVDAPKKIKEIEASARRYRMEKGVNVETSSRLSSIAMADVIVVVSSAGEVILEPEHVKEGAIVIDDTQPRNTSEHLLEKATVIDVLSEVPGLSIKFDIGLVKERPEVTFTCLAEVAILAAHGWSGDFSVGRPDLSKVTEIARMAEACGVRPARFVSFSRINTARVN